MSGPKGKTTRKLSQWSIFWSSSRINLLDLNKGKSDNNNIPKFMNIEHAPHQATKKENTRILPEKGATREKRKQKQGKKKRKIGQ
jgi:hypothetical protein